MAKKQSQFELDLSELDDSLMQSTTTTAASSVDLTMLRPCDIPRKGDLLWVWDGDSSGERRVLAQFESFIPLDDASSEGQIPYVLARVVETNPVLGEPVPWAHFAFVTDHPGRLLRYRGQGQPVEDDVIIAAWIIGEGGYNDLYVMVGTADEFSWSWDGDEPESEGDIVWYCIHPGKPTPAEGTDNGE